MGGCTAFNCSNHSRQGFRMFRFPRNEVRKRKWLINMRRDNWYPSSSAQLCICHFEDSQFENKRADGRKKLKQEAIPTLFNMINMPATLTPEREKGNGYPKSGSTAHKRKDKHTSKYLMQRIKKLEQENRKLKSLVKEKDSKPANLRDLKNPDWVPSINMGYENCVLADDPCEVPNENVVNVGCLNERDETDSNKPIMLRNMEISTSGSETVGFQDKLVILEDSSLQILESFSSENNSRTDKENTNINLIQVQSLSPMKKDNFTLSYLNLLKNLSFIKKPNNFWGISSHSNVIICARWGEDYTCEKKVVIEKSLIVRAFLKEWEINLSELMNIKCIDDISNLLEKVEKYEIL